MAESVVISDTSGDPGDGAVSCVCKGGTPEKYVIKDALLCSIIKAHSRNPPKDELVRVILRDAKEKEIDEAWTRLFTYFHNEKDKTSNKEIIKIVRRSRELMVRDIVDLIIKLDKEKDMDMFVMPWTEQFKPLPTEPEKRNAYWEEENINEVSFRISDFEKKMEKKHD